MALARVFVILGAAALCVVGAVARASDQEPILESKIALGKVAPGGSTTSASIFLAGGCWWPNSGTIRSPWST
jgi:hypothetical protein